MPPENRDPAYLWDMHEAARGIVQMTQGVTLSAFEADVMRRLAVERLLTILGEAARRVSDPLKASHPEIPWRPIVGLRNLVTHEYEMVDTDTIWQIATESVPELVGMLTGLIPSDPEDDVS